MTTSPGDMNHESGKGAHINALPEIERRRLRALLLSELIRILDAVRHELKQSGDTHVFAIPRKRVEAVCDLIERFAGRFSIRRDCADDLDRQSEQEVRYISDCGVAGFQIPIHDGLPLYVVFDGRVYTIGGQ